MPVQIKCPNPSCNATFQVGEALLGRNARCKSCGQKFPLQSMDGVSGTPSVDSSQRARATMLGQESIAGEPAPPLPRPQGETPAQVGRFQIRQCLGWGTFGTVYRAYDPQLDREVALKVPKPEVLDRPGRVERFLREGRAAARLRHPHIIPVFEAGQDGKNYYIASAFIEGSSLAGAIVAEEKGLDIRRAVRIVRALAEAVAYAHEQGIVHRDIKPANVMLDQKDQPLLMDFGLAARAEDQEKLTQDGAVLGTPAYMAPEQAGGQKGEAQPAGDQYALGSVLYELLTGHPPYEGLPVIVLHNVINTPIQRPRELRKDLPLDLEAICLKALAKKPEDRYPGCQDLADALGAWLDSQAKPMRPASVPKTGTWWQAELGRQEEKTRPSAGETGDFGDLIPGVSPAKESVKKESRASQRGLKRRASGWRGWVGNRWPVLAAAGAAALLVLLGIIIVIKWKSGEVSVEIKPSDGTEERTPSTGRAKKLPPRFKNSLGMEFVLVPKGTFWMGGGGGVVGKKKVEIEQDFYLGVYEVTQGEWQAVTGANPSHYSREGGGKEAVKDIPDAELKRFPVENVSWNDAQLFLAGLNAREKEAGWVYRLPTEAEWEYACRGGPCSDKTDYGYDFYFEKPTNELKPEQANFAPEPGKGLQRPCKVGSYKPNTLGLYDMHGNLWEWCDDKEKGNDGASLRVDRGGAWNHGAGDCRAAYRLTLPPSHRSGGHGLRLTRVPIAPKDNNPPAQAPQQDRPTRAEKFPPRFKNSLGMEFVLVPKGKFWMGGGGGEVGKKKVEIEQDFYLGVYEVTQGEWQAVTGDAPSHFSRKGGGTEAVKDISDADLKRFPVENISLPEARLFAEALTLREKEARWVYRLPTEAEWEYACRGGPGSDKTDYGYDFYFEKPTNELKPEQANFAPEPGKGLQRPCKVGSYIPNTLGLYDMHGNVWEWCDDEEKGGDGALLQVSRGGHWGDDSRSGYCRAAGRVVAPPSYCDSRRGLRLARVPVPPKNNNPPAQAPQQSGRPGEVFTNSLGMQFAWISPGSFLMGSPAEEQGRGDNEVQHRVTLTKGFYMGVYEVTRGQYAQFVKATGYRTQAEREGGATG